MKCKQIQCPECGSYKVKRQTQGMGITGFILLSLSFIFFFIFPAVGLIIASLGILLMIMGIVGVTGMRNHMECESCGVKWENKLP